MATASPELTDEEQELHRAIFETPSPEATIFERMVAIVAELPAIGKNQRNESQKFMYRGHDDVMNALNPLLSKHGVFFVPRVLDRTVAERQTRSGSTMYEVNLHVAYTFFGLKGDSFEASAWGEGTDSGDKSTNKAMTMALKNVLAQTFAVSTEELSDADATSPEPTTRGRATRDDASQRTERKQDRSFDVGSDLLPNAIKGEGFADALVERQTILASDLDWTAMLDVAATACMGPKSKRTAAQKRELPIRWSNTIAKIEELAEASGDYQPELGIKSGAEGDQIIRDGFEFGFGYAFSGDLPRRPEASDLPDAGETGGAEEASQSDDGPPGGGQEPDTGAA
jgi:hypothetical protein